MKIDLSHLKKLSAVRSGKNIRFLTPAVYSGGWCPMRIACNLTENMEGLSYLMVCMPECATHSRGFNSLPEGPNGEKRWLYVLDAKEVIFGCREGVCDALRQMEAEGARAVMMIATCVTDLIGEDFESILREMQPQLSMKLTYVTLGQFKNFGTPMGVSKFAQAMVLLMKNGLPRQERLVNILHLEAWKAKNTPVKLPLIVDALKERGIAVREITADASLDDFENAPDAALNLVLNPNMLSMAEEMEARFGTPYLALEEAFSVAEADEAYARLEALLGISLEGAFSAWRERAVQLEDRVRKELEGTSFAMITEVDMPIRLSVYLAGLGLKPLLIHQSDILPADLEAGKRLRSLGFDPPLCRIMNQDHDMEVIRDTLSPDLVIGYVNFVAEGMKCAEEMWDFQGITGYERAAGILTRILSVVQTGKMEEGGFDIHGPAQI